MARLAPRLTIGFKTSPQGVGWATLDATWARAGELDVFDVGWMNDHLTDLARPEGGASYEAVTLMAALAHQVPGKWLAHAVLSNTFRHPGVLAKQATVLDNVSGGRYILGLGAGWHEGEHRAFGIPLPSVGERFDRFESAIKVLRALFSSEATKAPGVTLGDPFYPLEAATNEPPVVRPGGPLLWLGVQRRRGIGLLARYGDGWPMPGDRAGDVRFFSEVRDRIRRALEDAGRNPDDFTYAGQVACGASRAERQASLESALAFVRAGADHVILGLTPRLGPDGLQAIADEVAEPLRAAAG